MMAQNTALPVYTSQCTEVVQHPDLSKFAVIRTDYVAMLGNRPAAMLLSIIEGWTNWLKARGKSIFVRLSGNAISDAVSGLFARKTFMKAGKLLEELGLVARVQRSSSDRTYQYLLQAAAVQNRLNLLVWWNTSARYIESVTGAITGNWLAIALQELETLLLLNVPFKTFQCPFEPSTNVPYDSTLKDSSKELKENTTTLAVASQKVEQEVVVKPCTDVPANQQNIEQVGQNPVEDDSAAERLEVVENAGIKLNATLEKTVLQYTLEQLKAAIAYYCQVKAKGRIEKKEAWFNSCLTGRWWENGESIIEFSELQQFNDWRNSSPKYRYLFSTQDIAITKLEPGQIGVLIDDKWVNWRDAVDLLESDRL